MRINDLKYMQISLKIVKVIFKYGKVTDSDS